MQMNSETEPIKKTIKIRLRLSARYLFGSVVLLRSDSATKFRIALSRTFECFYLMVAFPSDL